MKQLENREEIDVANPLICLTAEVDAVDTDIKAIFSTSKISRESSEARKQSFTKLFNSKLSNRSIPEEEKTASIQFDSYEPAGGRIYTPEHIRIITDE